MKSVEQGHHCRVSAKHWVALRDITHCSFPTTVCVCVLAFRELSDFSDDHWQIKEL